MTHNHHRDIRLAANIDAEVEKNRQLGTEAVVG